MMVLSRSRREEQGSAISFERERRPLTSNAKKSAVVELRLDRPRMDALSVPCGELFFNRHEVHTFGSSHLSPNPPMLCIIVSLHILKLKHFRQKTHVASSNTTTRLSFTNALARLSNDLSPTDKFAPSLSIIVSKLNFPVSGVDSVAGETRYERRRASQR